jgi:hypothetical protein
LRAVSISPAVSDSLSKIYEGDNGERVNVQEVNIKRRRNIWLRIGSIIFYIAIAGGIIAGVYIGFFKNTGTDSSLQFAITADQAIQANQEFTYTLDYSNQENIVLTNLELTVVYPDNFILTDTFPAASRDNNKWSLIGGRIESGETPEEALTREVQEESNMRVIKQIPLGYQEVINPNGTIDYQLRSFCLVEPIGDFIKDPAGSVTKIKLIDPKTYKKYFDWGRIGERIVERALDMLLD